MCRSVFQNWNWIRIQSVKGLASKHLDEHCVSLRSSYQRPFLSQQQFVIFHRAPGGFSCSIWLVLFHQNMSEGGEWSMLYLGVEWSMLYLGGE